MKNLAILLLVTAACSKTAEPAPAPPPSADKPAEKAASAPPQAKAPGELAWDAPPSFQTAPNTSGMRKATYMFAKVAGDDEDAEMSVMAASGGVDANVQRWSGQFGNAPPKTEPRSVNGLKVMVVEIKGTYNGGMMRGGATAKDKQMLLGAIVDMGDQQWFFKMTGPEKTVTAAKPDFDKLVSSLRTK